MEKIVIENCLEMMYNKCLNCKHNKNCQFRDKNIENLEQALQKTKTEKNTIFQNYLDSTF